MATKTKTFKIGEYCQGGIITAEVKGDKVIVIGKEWDYSKGSNRGSDQSGAKEFTRLEIDRTEYNAEHRVLDFLCDLTISYYADEVMKFIKTNATFNHSSW
jgi:hypothetical protein